MASTTSQTPSSSTSVSTTPTRWDVFLNFHGIDTRTGFISHLYSALDRHSIRTFKDDPELWRGEVISDVVLDAIPESKTYIVVLSENYASSSWCLHVLVEILNCSRTNQRLVIPVFYNIDPSVVRYQIGSFEDAFDKHEDRLAGEMERVANWRRTLTEVADKSGEHIDGKKSEAVIVQEIVDQILQITLTRWDVFLSFHGKDTRHGFTSHLYSALDRYSIPTFMDDPELQCGEMISDALIKAIQESKIYIVVLSENYASSSWCLDELVEILNCSRTNQRLVIPVFYHILPSVVRFLNESFKAHFKKHEDRLAGEMERVTNWRLTLRQVAEKSGKHINGTTSEADIVNEIVDEILLQIKPTVLDVAKHPVGLNSRVKDISSMKLLTRFYSK